MDGMLCMLALVFVTLKSYWELVRNHLLLVKPYCLYSCCCVFVVFFLLVTIFCSQFGLLY